MMESASGNERIRVAVVFGGRSAEHEVSCVTAGSVLGVLDSQRYDIVPIGITRTGRWVLTSADPRQYAITDGTLPEVDDTGGTVVVPTDPGRGELAVVDTGSAMRTLGAVDVVLPLLHGPFGEDGTIQGLLEMAGIPYVGSGVLGSAVGMDKHVMKGLLAAAGLPVGRHVLIHHRQQNPATVSDSVRDRVAELGWPVFVKPARGGSSVGISRVEGPDELEAAIHAAVEHDPKVIIEELVPGREIECGVLEDTDGGPPRTTVPGEIRVNASHDFYDFQAKYLDDSAELDIPADVPEDVVERARELAAGAFEALSCESLARVDLFLRPDGALVVNEVNTMPGFTPRSMFPQLWAASGLDYPSLVDYLLTNALARPSGLR